MATKKTTKKKVAKTDPLNYSEIKKWLGRGGIKQLAEEMGFDQKYAYHVLSGRSNNLTILSMARERALLNKEMFDSQSKRFADLDD